MNDFVDTIRSEATLFVQTLERIRRGRQLRPVHEALNIAMVPQAYNEYKAAIMANQQV